MLQRAHLAAFLIVAAATVVLLNLPDRTSSRSKLALSSLFLPLFGLAGSAQTLGERAFGGMSTKRQLEAELERLRMENERLKIVGMQSNEVLRENAQLRAALGWRSQTTWKPRLAIVSFRDPVNWFRTIRINAGSAEGIRTNAAVITPEGLIGRVDEVAAHSSRVVLVGDPQCKVAVVIRETGDTGAIAEAAMDSIDEGIVNVQYLHRHAQIRPGQTVYTSGLGGVFPRGVAIGSVVDARSVDFGLYQEARVKLAANFRHLEYVWVLTE
jgi:rod shape-determining protein MreC